jgi:AcrR family transcriptional regulator
VTDVDVTAGESPGSLGARDPEERRRRILAATVDVIGQRGFAGTRVADIAAAAGTSPALVLYHFSSLSEVLVAGLRWSDDAWYADVQIDAPDVDPVDALVALAAEAGRSGATFGDWSLWLEVWVRARHDRDVDQVRADLDRRWRAQLDELVTAGAAAGAFDAPDPSGAALRLACSMDGLAVQAVLGDPPELTPAQLGRTWLIGAARELGLPVPDLVARYDAAIDVADPAAVVDCPSPGSDPGPAGS